MAEVVAMEVRRAGRGMTAAAKSLHAGCMTPRQKARSVGPGGTGSSLGCDGSPERGSQDAARLRGEGLERGSRGTDGSGQAPVKIGGAGGDRVGWGVRSGARATGKLIGSVVSFLVG